jgi:hypothetical protein
MEVPTNINKKFPTQEMSEMDLSPNKYGRKKKNEFNTNSVEYSGEVNSTKPELIFT